MRFIANSLADPARLRRPGVALAFLATLLAALVFAAGALAANGGNSDNAKLCQKGGWQTLMDSSASQFTNPAIASAYVPSRDAAWAALMGAPLERSSP